MVLYCNVCHTRWSEACLDVFDHCPFTDCNGRLTMKPPVLKVKRPKKEQPERLPLFKSGGLPT